MNLIIGRRLPNPDPRPEAGVSDHVDVIRTLLAEILDVQDVGPHGNFFRGGNPTMAVSVVKRIRSDLDSEVPLRSFFEDPTAAGLAAVVSGTAMTRQQLIRMGDAQRRCHYPRRGREPACMDAG
jgi:hypothetical protein